MTRERINKFLSATEMNKTVFCRNIRISVSMLHCYLTHKREISINTENRINNYIDGYIAKIKNI